MVNNINPFLSVHPNLPHPPNNEDANGDDRLIGTSPVWDLADIVRIISSDCKETATARMVTRRSSRDYENLLENNFSLPDVIKSIPNDGIYKNSWWCKTGPETRRGKVINGVWIPCDAYSIRMPFENPVNGYSGISEYYLKMCKGLDGKVVLFVSLHQ